MKNKQEFFKHAYMNFYNGQKYSPVVIVLSNGKKIQGEIAKEYTYEIIVDRKVKDKEGNEMLQEILIPKHSIDYMYRNIKKKKKQTNDAKETNE
ncbi:TPA: hypothetical protein I1T43_002308 [Staphylococcus aureus]|nr:hypothetical protein [Staphylococcus aureus]